MSLTCYIIDDEPLAIDVLEAHIERYGDLEIAGTFQNAIKAFQAIHKQPVDLLFLDIQMPKLSGLSLLRSLEHAPHVILTTAYRDYAVEGFELDVVDYLVKPISFDRFLKAIGKVMRKTSSERGPGREEVPSEDRFLFARVDKKHVKVPLHDILHIESQRGYVKITTTSTEVRAPYKISDLEAKLRPEGFLRIHRSFIVPLDKVESWSASAVDIVGTAVPIGRTYKKEVMRLLESRSERL